MANVTATPWGSMFSGTIIDLTTSDTEEDSNTLNPRPVKAKQPSLSLSFRPSANIDIASDSLSGERSFELPSHVKPIKSSTLHSRLSNGTASLPRLAPQPAPRLMLKPVRSAKRKRINHGATKENPIELDKTIRSSSRIAIPGGTSIKTSSHPASTSTLAETIHARVQLHGGDKRDRERRINENLSRAPRQQVFPNINQRLVFYRRSIDRGTRKQLSKQAVSLICGDEFLDNLDHNNGRLSPTFEVKIAAGAQSIVDQLAIDILANSGVDKSSLMEAREECPLPDRVTVAEQMQSECQSGSDSKTPDQRRREKLSKVMKARWASGAMSKVMAAKVARNARKRARDLVPNPRLKRASQQRTPARLTTKIPIINLDSSALYDNGAGLTPPSRFFQKSDSNATRYSPQAMTLEDSFLEPSSRDSPLPKINAQRAQPVVRPRITRPVKVNPAKSKIEDLLLVGLDEHVSRPYLNLRDRHDIHEGLNLMSSKAAAKDGLFEPDLLSLQGSLLHVDFFKEEIEELITMVESISGEEFESHSDPYSQIQAILKGREELISVISSKLASDRGSIDRTLRSVLLKSRTNASIVAFLQDAVTGSVSKQSTVSRISLDLRRAQGPRGISDSLSSILQQRQTWGRHRYPSSCISFKSRILNLMEDQFVREAEWTDCAGDIATITWLDCSRFFCGATAHSDEHNMQYNKPGNLITGSVVAKTLNSVAGHQIVRPIVTKGENSHASMRESQDPWMYCSVTSTAYSYDNRKCFSGSYDQTVKVWDVADDGSSMELCGVWEHAGNVNFVVASPHHSLVATAADVREDAVRVYHFNPKDISRSIYQTYEASVQRRNSCDNWAYFPATMQWGISTGVAHMLLVGYSPRSLDANDLDIPDDKVNTGELCLWNIRDGSRIVIASARTQNVFEVVWHPSQPIFVAATSPLGDFEDGINTQLRVFGQTENGTFMVIKTLDCLAKDINEITLKPNSNLDCYVTASCTNGRTYVWDSAASEKPIHILQHGESIDEQIAGNSMEETDSGVKFAAWGRTCDRFYTGSSDGVVKAWNIRAPFGQAFIRDVICLSGGVSAGKFSPDFGNLILGDATGKVHLLTFGGFIQEVNKSLRRPITPHQQLLPPLIDEDDQEIDPPKTAQERARQFLDQRQIIISKDEYIGAIQGPNYASTGLRYDPDKYRDENDEHSSGWSMNELLAKQQSRLYPRWVELARLPEMKSSSRSSHERNLALDLDTATLPAEVIRRFRGVGIDLNFQDVHEFAFERDAHIDGETKGNILDSSKLLDPDEINEVLRLRDKISEELEIQKALETFLH